MSVFVGEIEWSNSKTEQIFNQKGIFIFVRVADRIYRYFIRLCHVTRVNLR
jgi:hypothetical protein